MTNTGPPQTTAELERYLPYLVNRLASLGQAAQNRALQGTGLGLMTMRTLSVLYIEDGLTINEIAARTLSEQSTISRTVDAMVGQDLVERRIPASDQRRREIVLKEAGRAVLHQNWPAMQAHFERIERGIPAEQRALVQAVMIRMLQNLADADD